MTEKEPAAVEEVVEQQDAADEAEEQDEAPKAKGGKKAKENGGPAARVSVASWWCPNDDRSMPIDARQCDSCGYVRER